MIEELCIKQVDDLTWRIGEGRTSTGRQLRSNLESIPGVGTQTVITWLGRSVRSPGLTPRTNWWPTLGWIRRMRSRPAR